MHPIMHPMGLRMHPMGLRMHPMGLSMNTAPQCLRTDSRPFRIVLVPEG